MARYKSIVSNFSGGLISPNLVGRTDIERTKSSLTEMTNFMPDLQGPMSYRHGFVINQRWRPPENSVSINLLLATNKSYQCIFFENGLHIVRSDGAIMTSFIDQYGDMILDPIATPYGAGALKDLRFSSETDALYVTHGTYKPRVLYPGLNFNSAQLKSTESPGVYNNLQSQEVDSNGNPTGNLNLYAEVEVEGDDVWTFEEIDFVREPFLDVDESGDELTASSIQRITKLESSLTTDFDVIITSGNPTDYYIEYEVDNVWLLGKVITSAANYPEVTLPNAGDGYIYVEPVDSVVDIEDDTARLYLVDNDADTASSTRDRDVLKRFGVPANKIVVRSDVRIFSNNQAGSWIRVADDRRATELPIQHDRTRTRWQRIIKHNGVKRQPVDYIKGQPTIDEANYNAGDVYKYLDLNGPSLDVKQLNTSGAAHYITAIIPQNLTGSTGVFTMYHSFSQRNSHSDRVATSSDDPNIVANMSTVIEVDEVECDTTADVVEEYTSSNTGGKLLTTTGSLTVTVIANEITLNSTGNTFNTQDIGRHLLGTLSKNHVYFKINRFVSATNVTAELLSPFPKNPITNTLEDSGRLDSFRMGAWYEDNYPRTVAKYEQRRVYGGTYKQPNYVFFSKSGEELDFSPVETNKQVLDTNGISYPLSNINSSIRWMKSGTQLVIGTTGGVFRLLPNQFAASVSPTSIRIEMSDDEGCDKDGILVGSSVFFPDQSNSRLMEYNYESTNGNFTNDVSKLLYPTFVDDSIRTLAYQHTPQPRLWVLTQQHRLYVLTYYKAENFYAWSKVETYGDVQDICVMREGSTNDIDQVWITRKGDKGMTHEYIDESLDCYMDGATVDSVRSGFGTPGSSTVQFIAGLMPAQIGFSNYTVSAINGQDITFSYGDIGSVFTSYYIEFVGGTPIDNTPLDITAVDVANKTFTVHANADVSGISVGDTFFVKDYERYLLTDQWSSGEEVDLVVNGVYMGVKTLGTSIGQTFVVFVNEQELIEAGAMNDTTPFQTLNYVIGRRYTAKATPMNPSYDISNGNVFGAEESRVVSAKALIAKGISYEIGVNGTFEKIPLKTLTAYDKEAYSGFDRERPLPNSLYGEDKIPQIRHSDPHPLTISALITKSDIHV